MNTLQRILIVEDDRLVRTVVRLGLEHEGYRVLEASDGAAGLDQALAQKPDLVVLDLEMPKLSGLEVCRELRRLNFGSPILMLTVRHLVEDRVKGLNAGADDYLPKPFELNEFSARIYALLRRHDRVRQERMVLRLGEVEIDFGCRTAMRAGQPLQLTKTEFALLELLGKRAGRIVSRETILDAVWGYTKFPTTRTIDTHVWRLRKKIGDDAANPKWIKHYHGQGYSLEGAEEGAIGTMAVDAGQKSRSSG